MSKQSFTPGPWFCPHAAQVRTKAEDVRIADVDGRDADEMEANAGLIAASPDMYEALSLVDAYLYATAPDSNERQIVQMALAKAEGRS